MNSLSRKQPQLDVDEVLEIGSQPDNILARAGARLLTGLGGARGARRPNPPRREARVKLPMRQIQ